MTFLKSYLSMLIALIVLDAVWIALFMGGLYEREIGTLLGAEPNLVAALIFYLAYPLGAFVLAVKPALDARSVRSAVLKGAVLGGVAYGTFAVTNLAVLEGWTTTLTVVDSVWGMFVTAAVCSLGYWVSRR